MTSFLGSFFFSFPRCVSKCVNFRENGSWNVVYKNNHLEKAAFYVSSVTFLDRNACGFDEKHKKNDLSSIEMCSKSSAICETESGILPIPFLALGILILDFPASRIRREKNKWLLLSYPDFCCFRVVVCHLVTISTYVICQNSGEQKLGYLNEVVEHSPERWYPCVGRLLGSACLKPISFERLVILIIKAIWNVPFLTFLFICSGKRVFLNETMKNTWRKRKEKGK